MVGIVFNIPILQFRVHPLPFNLVMKIYTTLIAATVVFSVSSCSKKDTTAPYTVECFADHMSFTQRSIKDYPTGHNVFITFDVKNTSTKDYDVDRGAKMIVLKVNIATTDSAHYETNVVFTKSKIAAGDSTTAMVSANYGTGKTFSSYNVIAGCY
jgi:hypothetical protein